MWYIKKIANEDGSRGNPQSNCPEGFIALPDNLLGIYLDYEGFVNLEINEEENVIVSLTKNQEAYDAFIASQPPPIPYQPTKEDDIQTMLIDQEYRITLLELGIQEVL